MELENKIRFVFILIELKIRLYDMSVTILF